ncbi:MAG: antitoxin VapB family protein [Halorientalis sp.]
MSKTISVSDEVYERLERERGDRSFNEVIADRFQSGGTLAEVTGEGVLDGTEC